MECYPKYSSKDLEVFTESFSEKNSLGYTLFGKLYRAKIEDKEVLVKRWLYHRRYGKDALQIENKSSIMGEIRFLQHHQDLVRVIGYCIRGPEMGIIYDLNPMDSLQSLIIKENFNWIQRIKVAHKFAELLDYLHSQLEEPYMVRNLDASHIIIDQDFNPRLIDFTMLSGGIMGDKASQERYALIVHGYCAPDLFRGGRWTVKTDVYIYGVILLSLIAKRVFHSKGPDTTFVDDWACKEYDLQQGSCSLVHTSLQTETAYDSNDGYEITKLAMRCLDVTVINRPTMKEIVLFLQNLRVNGTV